MCAWAGVPARARAKWAAIFLDFFDAARYVVHVNAAELPRSKTQSEIIKMSEANAQMAQQPSQAAENVEEKEFTLNDVEFKYFMPSELESAAEYMQLVGSVAPADSIKANFDGENVKDGYGIAVYPIKKRVENEGNVTIGVAFCQLPDPDLIAQLPENRGVEFIRNAVIDKLMTKIATAFRPRPQETADEARKREASVPVEVEAFLTSARGDGSLKTYTELAPTFVKALRKMGLKHMHVVLLRQVLSSEEFAKAQFPKIPQETWLSFIDRMVNIAREKKLDPSVFIHWKDSRGERTVTEVDELNLDELDKLI